MRGVPVEEEETMGRTGFWPEDPTDADDDATPAGDAVEEE